MVLSGLTGVGKQQKKKKKKMYGVLSRGEAWEGVWKLEGGVGSPFCRARGSSIWELQKGVSLRIWESQKGVSLHIHLQILRHCYYKKKKNEKTLPMTPLIVTNSSSGNISAERRIAFNVSNWKVQGLRSALVWRTIP